MASKSIFLLILSATLIAQIHAGAKEIAELQEALTFATDFNTDIKSEIAQNTISKMMYHLGSILGSPNGGKVIMTIATNFQKAFTSEVGQKNILEIAKLIGFLLKDPQSSKIIQLFCDQIIAFAADDSQGRQILKTSIVGARKVLENEHVLDAALGLVQGLKYLSSNVPMDRIEPGVERLKNISKMLTYSSKPVEVTARDLSHFFDTKQITRSPMGLHSSI